MTKNNLIIIYNQIIINYMESTIEKHRVEGRLHVLYGHLTQGYKNKKVPYVSDKYIENKDIWLICDPRDCERLARKHIKKMPNLADKVMDSIISTTDVEHWQDQRSDFVEAFIPNIVLNDLIPGITERVKESMIYLRNNVNGSIDISEFFLNETQAQLQLNMFGFSKDFEIETNKKVRDSFNSEDKKYLFKWSRQAIKNGNGPLGEVFKEREPWSSTEQIGNAIVFSFAGHDTTAHTLSWLIYELAKNRVYQDRLREEVKAFWDKYDLDNNIVEMENLKELKFMTLCITEILRMWPANSNGTFRELVEDDYIHDEDNNQINLPKGTFFQIVNWARHRSEKLWGKDCNVFNPDRQFKDSEIWENKGYAFTNPYSDRYSPFTYPPRDCIGKNFSQLEMRIMLLHIFRELKFETKYITMEGLNNATMGPRDPQDENSIGMPIIVKLIGNSKL